MHACLLDGAPIGELLAMATGVVLLQPNAETFVAKLKDGERP